MPRHGHVLVVGNGLSLLGEELVSAGWHDVCAIDYSATCTEVGRRLACSAECSLAGQTEGRLRRLWCKPQVELSIIRHHCLTVSTPHAAEDARARGRCGGGGTVRVISHHGRHCAAVRGACAALWLNIMWWGEGKGVSTPRVSPPAPLSRSLYESVWAAHGAGRRGDLGVGQGDTRHHVQRRRRAARRHSHAGRCGASSVPPLRQPRERRHERDEQLAVTCM
jgi:hypothetical protein